MKARKPKLPKQVSPFAYFALAIYVCIFFVCAWFSSYQNRVALQLREEFEQQRSQLLDEINKLEVREAELTAIERIHEVARELNMVQPTEPATVLQAD